MAKKWAYSGDLTPVDMADLLAMFLTEHADEFGIIAAEFAATAADINGLEEV